MEDEHQSDQKQLGDEINSLKTRALEHATEIANLNAASTERENEIKEEWVQIKELFPERYFLIDIPLGCNPILRTFC
jgi:hypothetical protein